MSITKPTLIAALMLAAIPAFAKGPKVPYDHKGITSADIVKSPDVRWVTVDEIKESIKDMPPMTVSFDIDDTVLVSSQCFYYGRNKWSPNGYEYLHNQKFWDYVADGCDLSSIPKESAKKLIEMHQARGDQVVFITGRTPAKKHKDGTMDQLAKILERTFGVKNMKPISYTRDTPVAPYKYDKTAYIVKAQSKIHYGDSNDDVLAAREAGIRGIRVIRSAVSTNRPLPVNGGYGEEVVVDSSY